MDLIENGEKGPASLTTITASALADLFGVTDRTVRDLDKRGIVVRAGRKYALAAFATAPRILM